MHHPYESSTPNPHIDFDDKGNPKIVGTRMKVVLLVMEQQGYGWSPEEMQDQHPHVILEQINAALAFYRDHKEQLDAEIARRDEYAERMRREAGPSQLAAKLRAQGRL